MTRQARWAGIGAAALVLAAAATAEAQSLASRAAAAPDGKLRMSFAARPGVCGYGENIVSTRHTADWESACDPGPVRVVLSVLDGRVTGVKTYVGGRWRPAEGVATDLGMVSAPRAADYLLSLAAKLDGRAGKDAILPATLADSAAVWPALLAIARDTSRPRETRKAAVFWLGQAAGKAATEGLESLALDRSGDRAVREHAIFALSQRPHVEGVPALIRIARTHPDPALRKKAIFWLGQSEDPRALALFEELLTKH